MYAILLISGNNIFCISLRPLDLFSYGLNVVLTYTITTYLVSESEGNRA